jgi:hypothetical protein
MKYTVGRSWYSWIPTNLGFLNFNYVADFHNLLKVFGENNFSIKSTTDKKIVKLHETNLSDLNCFITKALDINEEKLSAEIVLNNETIDNKVLGKSQPSKISGTCNIAMPDNNIFQIKSIFTIERTGKIIIKDIIIIYQSEHINKIENNNTLNQTVANAVYTLIKKIVHGDNHHDQKVDTMIGVYTEFEPRQILTDLGFQLKRIEKFVKTNHTPSLSLIYDIDKVYAYNVAKGFQSYIETFNNLFLEDKEDKEDKEKINLPFITKENIENVILSIEAGVLNYKSKKEEGRNFILFMVTFIALFSSLNILYSTFFTGNQEQLPFYAPSKYTALLATFIIMSLLIFGKPIITFFSQKLRLLTKEKKFGYSLFELFVLIPYIKSMSNETRKQFPDKVKILNKFKYKIIFYLALFSISFLSLSIAIYFHNTLLIIAIITFIMLLICLLSYKVSSC